jgi:hypothetical protein
LSGDSGSGKSRVVGRLVSAHEERELEKGAGLDLSRMDVRDTAGDVVGRVGLLRVGPGHEEALRAVSGGPALLLVAADLSKPERAVRSVVRWLLRAEDSGVARTVPAIIVGCKSDVTAASAASLGAQEEVQEKLARVLRTVCLQRGNSALVYCSASSGRNCQLLRGYVQKLLFPSSVATASSTSASASLDGGKKADAKNAAAGSAGNGGSVNYDDAEVAEREALFVPIGWDSRAKVALSAAADDKEAESGNKESSSKAKGKEDDLQQQEPNYLTEEFVNAVEKEKDGKVDGAVPSRKREVEMVQAENEQVFLHRHFKALEALREEDEIAAKQAKRGALDDAGAEVIAATPSTPSAAATASSVAGTPIASAAGAGFTTPQKTPSRVPLSFQTPTSSTTSSTSPRSAAPATSTPAVDGIDDHAELANFFNSLISKDKSPFRPGTNK